MLHGRTLFECWKIFHEWAQSLSGHVINVFLLYKHQWTTKPFHFGSFFGVKGAIYYVAIAMVIFSHVKITCYFHIWRYQVFARKLTWYFIGVYIINMFILQSIYSIVYRVMFCLLSYPLLKLLLMVFPSFSFLLSSFLYCMRIFCNFSDPNLGPWF